MLGHLVSTRHGSEDDHFTRGAVAWFGQRSDGQASWIERLFVVLRRHLPR